MTTYPLPLQGVIPPMITPLAADGAIDIDGLRRLVAHLLAGGVSGIFVLGSSGEGPWLTLEQVEVVIRSVVQAADGRVPVLAGLLEPGTLRILDALGVAESAGADAVVVTTPYYFEADAALQLHHFQSIARSTDLPVVLYNIPSKTHNPLFVETVAQLLEVENVIGIKDSSGDWDHLCGLLALRQRRPDFCVLQGTEGLAGRSLLVGADGVVPGLGNLMPDLFVRMVTAARAGDEGQVRALQDQVDALGTLHTHGHWLACLKYAASLFGFGTGTACGRPNDLPDEARRAIRTIVDKVRNATISMQR